MKKLPTRAQLDAAERRTASAMNDPEASPRQRRAGAERERQAGAGLWPAGHSLEAKA
jgi:hypothetical protein